MGGLSRSSLPWQLKVVSVRGNLGQGQFGDNWVSLGFSSQLASLKERPQGSEGRPLPKGCSSLDFMGTWPQKGGGG